MAVAVDVANIFTITASGAGPFTNPVTCAAIDKYLLSLVSFAVSPAASPTAESYNSVALTNLGHATRTNTMAADVSAFGLANPATGSPLTFSWSWATSATGLSFAVLPLSGVGSAPPTTFANSATSATASVTATGGGSNDLYIGSVIALQGSTVTSSGGQTHLITPVTNAGFAYAVDSLPGAGSGAFSWTLAGSEDWVALGITVLGAAVGAGPAARCIYVMP